MNSLYKRIGDNLVRVAANLRESGIGFHSTMIDSVREMVKLLPALNITQDPEVERIRGIVQSQIACFSTEQLKSDDSARLHALGAAQVLLDDMGITAPTLAS